MNAGSERPQHDPFAGEPILRVVPTTEPQREVLAAAALGDVANTAYNEVVAVRVRGPLPFDVVRAALRALVARHDALRATFTPQLDAMCIGDGERFDVDRVDLTALAAPARDAAVTAAHRDSVATPLPLRDGPLFRARWLQLAADEAELLLVAHHVVCDGWSYHVLLRELALLCGGASASALPPAPSFADFAAGCRGRSAGRGEGADAAHWRARFRNVPPALDLPTDGPRPVRRTFVATRVDHRLGAAAARGLTALARDLRASPAAVLLASVAALLARLTDAEDLVLGMPVARQPLEQLPGLVGHCVQLLPIRLAVDPAARFDALVARARAELLDATEHHDFTFGSLVRDLGLSGDARTVPLVPVIVNVDQTTEVLQLGDARATVATVPRTAEGFEIFLNLVPAGDGALVEATCNRDLFDPATIAGWLAALDALLAAAAAAPTTPIGRLDLLGDRPAEPAGFNDTARPGAVASWLPDLLAAAAKDPARVAVRDAGGTLAYGELIRRARRLAAELVQRGVRRGDVVGCCVTRTRELPIALTAIHLAGAAYLPLDPTFPPARLAFVVADAGAVCLVSDLALPPALAARPLPVVDPRALDDGAAAAAQLPVAQPPVTQPPVELPPVGGDDLAYVIYTSGSTGTPKGVRVRHRSLGNALRSAAARPGFRSDDTLLAITTVAFDISLLELLLPLAAGGCVAVATQDEAEDPVALAGLLVAHRVTVLQATPATWRLLLEGGWNGAQGLTAFCGGERLPAELAAALLPRVRALWNLYGPTETTIWSAARRVEDGATAALVGTPFDNTRIHVLDRHGARLPAGVPGEICIAGLGVAEGYHGLPQLTAERFVDHLSLGRLYRTGDRGRIRPGGVLECLGRLDHQVKVRGHRIELGEIEAVLGAHPGVVEAAATVAGAGSSDARLVAFFVARDGAPLPDLGEHLARTLPAYMRPHQLVPLPALPRLPNGKLDRRALRAPAATAVESAAEDPPRTPAERTIAAAMAVLLGRDDVAAGQDFFAAGGHSLLAAQLVARLNRDMGGALTLRCVFEAPTPRALARLLDGDAEDRPPAERVPARADQGVAPATPVQERMWHMQQLDPSRATYNLPSAHRLQGPFDAAVFHRALQEVVDRQAALRTTFERRQGALWQRVHERFVLPALEIEDLSTLPADAAQRRLRARMAALAAAPIDPARLPLFRVALFRLAAEEHVFFFMPHHLVWDGWSFDLLYEEMAALLAAFAAGLPSPLPALTVSFGDIAAWQQALARDAAMLRRVEALRERLRRFGDVAPLPADRPRRPGMSGEGACLWLDLDVSRTRALHELGRRRGATLSVVLLAIYGALLHEYCGRPRLLLATPVRGRESVEQEAVMGCCNSLVPLPIEVRTGDSFAALVARVKQALVEGLATADVTLEQVGSAAGRGPALLYQALFSLQDVRRRPVQWGALRHRMIPLLQRGATEDLGLWFVEGDEGLSGMLTYNAEVLDEATALRLKDRFLALADAFAADPDQPLDAVVQPRVAPAGEAVPAPSRVVPPQPGDRTVEAGNDLELVLVDVWRRVLGVDRVGVHDDFFALGGNSLTAIRCVAEFEAATGLQLDLGEVFRSPTIRALVASIGERGRDHGPMLIPLQPEGAEPPLFCLLGIWIYRHLALGLGKDQPVFGVYLPEERGMVDGLAAPGEAEVSIARLAAAYVDVIVRFRPDGPYRLAGLSFGGVVAMEVARLLRRRGAEVLGVVLLDSILPTSYRRRWWARLAHALRAAPGRGLRWLARQRARIRSAGPVAAGAMASSAQAPHDRAFQRVAGALRAEVSRWLADFEAPDVPVLLLRATDNAWGVGYVVEFDYGWGAIVGDRLQIASVPGDHLGILLTPEIGDLAASVAMFFAVPGRSADAGA